MEVKADELLINPFSLSLSLSPSLSLSVSMFADEAALPRLSLLTTSNA